MAGNNIATRLFNPSYYDRFSSNPEVFQGDSQVGGWCYVQCPSSDGYYTDSIIIAVDGACRYNGTPSARAAIAAYFHPDNDRYNEALYIDGLPQTNQCAELAAGILALDLAAEIKDLNCDGYGEFDDGPEESLSHVVIKSDSEYLVKGMTRWIYSWRRNGFRNSRGLPVRNSNLFRDLDSKIEALNDRGVQVQFWHVPRAQNRMADYLAKSRLEGLTAAEAMEMY